MGYSYSYRDFKLHPNTEAEKKVAKRYIDNYVPECERSEIHQMMGLEE